MRGTIVIMAQMITALPSLIWELFTKMPHSCKASWRLVCHRYGGACIRVVAWSVCILYTTLSSHTDTAPISTLNSENMWAVFNCIWTLTKCIGETLFICKSRNPLRDATMGSLPQSIGPVAAVHPAHWFMSSEDQKEPEPGLSAWDTVSDAARLNELHS